MILLSLNSALQSTTGLLNEHFSILVTGELQTEVRE